METTWEEEIAALLEDLSTVQSELLALLSDKQKSLMSRDLDLLGQYESREHELIERLQACHQRRGELLDRAREAELPSDSLRALASALEGESGEPLAGKFNEAGMRCRLLAHKSLANWVFVQRSLLHLSGMLEIIATGGRPKPTYGKGESAHSGGSIVDRAA